ARTRPAGTWPHQLAIRIEVDLGSQVVWELGSRILRELGWRPEPRTVLGDVQSLVVALGLALPAQAVDIEEEPVGRRAHAVPRQKELGGDDGQRQDAATAERAGVDPPVTLTPALEREEAIWAHRWTRRAPGSRAVRRGAANRRPGQRWCRRVAPE